ncbi:hypothetical protein LZ31DRAFT_371990 [Colletotrichum somersetense]|nr:hypothetical protein LZ31DRAFT_371990 [Colletotrichum somersetense]
MRGWDGRWRENMTPLPTINRPCFKPRSTVATLSCSWHAVTSLTRPALGASHAHYIVILAVPPPPVRRLCSSSRAKVPPPSTSFRALLRGMTWLATRHDALDGDVGCPVKT